MSVSGLIKSINGASKSPAAVREEERLALIAACEGLIKKLELPKEASMKILLAPRQLIVIRLGIEMGLFDAAASLSAEDGELKMDDLYSKMDADPQLVVRIMRFLFGMGVFHELGQGRFTMTPLANLYVSTSPLRESIFHMISSGEVIDALPAYFAKNGYQNPTDTYNSPFQFAHSTKLHFFDWLAQDSMQQRSFDIMMSIFRSTQMFQSWFEYVPVATKLHVTLPSDVLLVDVGGGIGHDLVAFRDKFPASILPGTLVVQDRAVVLEGIASLPHGIRAVAQDFFHPNSIKGAAAYYLSNILHDWPDKQALQILGHVRDAMGPGSLLFVNEKVLPEQGVPLRDAGADMLMMALFAAMERTEAQFRALFDAAGLRLVRAWVPNAETNVRRTMEVVLKET